MSVSARLDGVPLLSDPPVRWESIEGVRPYEGSFSVRASDIPQLVGVSAEKPLAPVVLEIKDGEGRQITIKDLYVIGEEPREFPAVGRVRVVDRRWFWAFVHVSRVFNRRRVVGSKRRRSAGTPPELSPLVPRISFHPATIKGGTTLWTAREALESVLTNCLRSESQSVGFRADFEIDPKIGKELDTLPLEDVELEDSGENALQRLMTYLPEARVKVTNQGKVIVYSALDGADVTLVNATRNELYGMGNVRVISNARLRPRRIHIFFTREHEVRFDFEESGEPTTIQGARSFSNVLPIPDFFLDVGGNRLDQGTWISLVDAFNSWKGAPHGFTQLNNAGAWFKALRSFMLPYNDMWTPFGLVGVRVPDVDWMGRVGAIQEHWRRTWRISPDWMSRIEQLKANLVATIDPTTGTRAPALVFADYSRLAAQRSMWIDRLDDQAAVYAMNVAGSPASDQAALTTGRAAPFELSVVDEDQGIIHYDFRPDPFRQYESAVPGMIGLGESVGTDSHPDSAGPTWDINDPLRPIAFNAISRDHSPPQLTAPFRVAVLLTAVPATYNSFQNQHLFKITRKSSDVQKFLPKNLQHGIGTKPDFGPDLEIRVNATIETARVAWVDAAATDISLSFGVGEGSGFIDDLVINLEGDAQGGASLNAIADALAAKTYAMLADRYQGERSVPLHPGADPVGHIESVGHEVTTGGAALTNIRLPEKIRDIDLFSLLPDSTRRLILRQAPSPGKRP